MSANRNGKVIDLTVTQENEDVLKDIGTTPIVKQAIIPVHFQSMEQDIIIDSESTVEYGKPETEFQLQWVPKWLLEKEIQAEKDAYVLEKVFQKVDIRILDRSANVISSHHLFFVKNGSRGDTRKLKCRFIPHGSPEKEMYDIGMDVMTAQFQIIRNIFSLPK